MASRFDRDPVPAPSSDPYSRDRIEKEIAHLRKRGSVRHAPGHQGYRAAWPTVLLLGALLWLFFMDPVLHSLHRNEAVRAYVYLHRYGSDPQARRLLATGIFTSTEIELLDSRTGSFQCYYSGPSSAWHAADKIIQYLNGVALLHDGDYAHLDTLGKIRYQLFVRWGLRPPMSWSMLDRSVND